MRKFIYLSFTCISLFLLQACLPEEIVNENNLSFPNGLDFKIESGIMNFKNQQSFDSLVKFLSNKDSEFLANWENKVGIKSIRSIYEKSVAEEESFLQNLVSLHGNDGTLTRKEIGYSEFTNQQLSMQALFLDDDGVVDINILNPSFSSLLNEDRVVKIDGKLYQFGRYEIKVIEKGELSKIKLLKDIIESDNGIGVSVIPVERNSRSINSELGRVEANWSASCSNSNGNYKVIGYEEESNYSDGYSCLGYWSFYVKVRSLRKILGTWQNYNTGAMKVTGNIKIIHWIVRDAHCNGCAPDPNIPPVVWRQMVDETNVTHNLSFGNTGYYYYINQYPMKCITYPAGYTAQYKTYKRYYTVAAYNSTSCSFGADPFLYCEIWQLECPSN